MSDAATAAGEASGVVVACRGLAKIYKQGKVEVPVLSKLRAASGERVLSPEVEISALVAANGVYARLAALQFMD